MAGKEATTTLKLESCAFSNYKIYPGRGIFAVKRDGKTQVLLNHKVVSLNSQKIKPAKLKWTPAWRRAHKKLVTETSSSRKKQRNTTRTQKAIAGVSVDILEAKKQTLSSAQQQQPILASRKKNNNKK